jgi:endonuclease G, mitochondrial
MSRSIRFAVALPLLLISTSGQAAFGECLSYFPNQTPPSLSASGPGQIRDLCMSDFAIRHSGESKTAVFVVEKLNRARLLDARDERPITGDRDVNDPALKGGACESKLDPG